MNGSKIKNWLGLLLLITSAVGASEGGEIYKRSCAVCHSAGASGTPDAPKVGRLTDPKFGAEWYRRLFAGRISLLHSVLNGKGAMPPKGGDASLSDAQAEAALNYMLSEIETPSASSSSPVKSN